MPTNRALKILLKDAGIEYFIGDSHAILYGDPRPKYGVHAPVKCANGVAVFARDVETSQQVWSAEVGYPGNPYYREFYRDVGWDLPFEYLKTASAQRRSAATFRFKILSNHGQNRPKNRLTFPRGRKKRPRGMRRDFIDKRIKQAYQLRDTFGEHPPLVISPYDAELYGHWWYEGPQFIDYLFRKFHYDQSEIKAVTPGDFLDSGIPIQVQQPSASSWGERGYYKVWLNEDTGWMYPYAHDAETKMTELANNFQNPTATEWRILNQMARELLLAQSSDWAFQIYQGTTVQYATKRFQSHIHRFNLLYEAVTTGEVNFELLAEIESRDTIFQEIDYRIYRS